MICAKGALECKMHLLEACNRIAQGVQGRLAQLSTRTPSTRHHDAEVRSATCMQVHVYLHVRAHVQANKPEDDDGPGGSHLSTHGANEEIDGSRAWRKRQQEAPTKASNMAAMCTWERMATHALHAVQTEREFAPGDGSSCCSAAMRGVAAARVGYGSSCRFPTKTGAAVQEPITHSFSMVA